MGWLIGVGLFGFIVFIFTAMSLAGEKAEVGDFCRRAFFAALTAAVAFTGWAWIESKDHGLGSLGALAAGFGVSAAAGWGIACLASLLFYDMRDPPPFETVQSPKPRDTSHGAAEWASRAERNARHVEEGKAPPLLLGVDHDQKPIWYRADYSMLTFGPTGSGKGITGVIPNVLMYPGSVFITDPKGTNTRIAWATRSDMGKTVKLDPMNEAPEIEGSGFNPNAALDPASPSFELLCDAMAASLIIPDAKDPHWAEGAQIMLSGLLAHFATVGGDDNNLPDIYGNIITAQPEARDAAFRYIANNSPSPHARRCLTSFVTPERIDKGTGEIYYEEQGKENGYFISAARTQLKFLSAEPIRRMLRRSDFTPDDFKRGIVSVFYIVPFDKTQALSRLSRVIFTSLIGGLMRAPARSVYFCLDELGNFLAGQQLAAINQVFTAGREYGLRAHGYFQDYEQAKKCFGDSMRTLESGSGVLQFFTANDVATFAEMERRGHERTERYTTESESQQESWGTSTSSGDGQNARTTNGESYTRSNSRSRSGAVKASKLITPQIAFQLEEPVPQNGYTGHQILFYRRMSNPVFAWRTAYWNVDGLRALAADNPLTPGLPPPYQPRSLMEAPNLPSDWSRPVILEDENA